MLKIHEVGDINLHGRGIGKETVTAEVTVVNEPADLTGFRSNNILVTYDTDNSMLDTLAGVSNYHGTTVPYISCGHSWPGEKYSCHYRGETCTRKLTNGQIVIMNCQHGQIYQTPSTY